MAVTNGLNLRIKHGASNYVSTCEEHELDDQVNLSAAVPSNAGGGEINTVGAKDFTARARAFQRVPVIYPGDGEAGATTLVGNNGATEWSALAVCKSLGLTCDIGASNNLTAEYQFEGMGAITRQASSLTADTTEPDVWNAINGFVKWMPVGQVSYATLPDCTQWSISLEVETFPYVGSGEGSITKRTVGPKRVSGSFTFLQDTLTYETAVATLLTPGAMGKMQLYLTAGTYLEIWYPVIGAAQVRSNTRGNNEITHPWTWTAYAPISGTNTIGKVLKPKKEAAPDAAWFGSV